MTITTGRWGEVTFVDDTYISHRLSERYAPVKFRLHRSDMTMQWILSASCVVYGEKTGKPQTIGASVEISHMMLTYASTMTAIEEVAETLYRHILDFADTHVEE